jgi:copper chaperone CopZ
LPCLHTDGKKGPRLGGSRPTWAISLRSFGYIRVGKVDAALGRIERKETTMPDVHVYVNRPAEKEGMSLEDLGEALGRLDHVTDVDVNTAGNVVAVSYEGGKAEQEEIERAVEEAGYEISRLSVRSNVKEERNLWDI